MFRITGHLAELPDSTIILQQQLPDYSHVYDTVTSRDGHFEFAGVVAEPQYAIIWYHPQKSGIPIYIENTAISLSGNIDSLDQITITGSATQDEFAELKNAKSSVDKEKGILNEKYESAILPKDSALIRYLDESWEKLTQKSREISEHYVVSHPKSFISLYEIRNLMTKLKYDEVNELFSGLDGSLQKSILGKAIANSLNIIGRTQIGQPAIDFKQPDVNGNPVSLSGYKGRFVLLDFWASSCYPCRIENKNLVEMYKQYNDDGFEILGVSYDNDTTRWKGAIKHDGLLWTNVCDLKGLKNEAIVAYGVTSFPTNYLINPEGVIIAKNLRGENLHLELERLFKRK